MATTPETHRLEGVSIEDALKWVRCFVVQCSEQQAEFWTKHYTLLAREAKEVVATRKRCKDGGSVTIHVPAWAQVAQAVNATADGTNNYAFWFENVTGGCLQHAKIPPDCARVKLVLHLSSDTSLPDENTPPVPTRT